MPERTERWMAVLASRYRVERRLGEGATSVVYVARDLKHDRDVALKVLRPELAHATYAERFAREIRVVAGLAHPHILPLFDSGDVDGRLYFVMPLVKDETLRARMRRDGPLPIDDALSIARQVASALDYAHAHHVVHRDIKPENILLVGGEVQVADFGVAYALDAAANMRITASGLAVGTPPYMSPEQAHSDEPVDGRTDIYSLGCVLYEMLTGEPPFSGENARSVMARHAMEPPPSVRVKRPEVPEAIDRAVRAALAKSPAERPGSGAELVTRMSGRVAVQRSPRSRALRAALIVGVLGALGLGAWLASRRTVLPRGERSWVLVADFSTPDSDRALGNSVRDLVTAELNQSQVMSVVPPDQLTTARRNAQIPDSASLNLQRARELAVRSAVRVVVTGSVSRIGQSSYAIAMNAVSADDGRNVASETASATDHGDELIQAIGHLARDLRRDLGERRDDIAATRPLTNISTPSFAAFRLYTDGQAAQRTGNYNGSVDLLRQAVAQDTAFTAAWALMAMNFVAMRQADSATRAFGHALAHPDRLSEAEADRLRGDVAYQVDHDLNTAVQWYAKYLTQRPLSIGGHNNLGLYLSALGRHQEALAEFSQARTIDPLYVGPRQSEVLNSAAELVVLGRADSARVVSRELRGAFAQYMDMLLLNANGRWDSLAAVSGRLASDPVTQNFVRIPARTHEAGARAALGDSHAASQLLERAVAASTGGEMRWYLHARLLLDLVRDSAPDWHLPDAVRADTAVGAELLRGVYGAQTGDTVAAIRALDGLRRRDARGARAIGFGREYLSALLSARRGDWKSAATLVAEPARVGENDPFSLDRVSSLGLWWLEAEALAGSGKRPEAAALLERLVKRPELPPGHFALRGLVLPYAERRLKELSDGRVSATPSRGIQ